MAFDPDAFLASAGAAPARPAPGMKAAAFNPDDFIASTTDLQAQRAAMSHGPAGQAAPEAGTMPVDNTPSTAAALGRGALQGVTLGFSDEIGGAVGSLFSDKTYQQVRDEIRANDRAAKEAHPIAFGAGELGGGVATAFVPGLNVARGAKLAATVGKAALGGAVAGVGQSEADLTKGEVGQLAKDAVTSAALAAGTAGAVGKLAQRFTGGARDRAMKDIGRDITSGVGGAGGSTVTDKKRVAKDLEDIFETLTKPENAALRKALPGNTDKAKEILSDKLSEVGSKLAPHYSAIDEKVGGVTVGRVVDGIQRRIGELAQHPGNSTEIGALESMVADVTRSWAPKADDLSTVLIPTRELRKYTTTVQNAADKTLGALAETERKGLKDNLAGVVKGILDEHLDDAATKVPELADRVKAIRAINSEFSALKNIEGALTSRSWKEETRAMSAGGIGRQLVDRGGLMFAGAAALSGNFGPAVALGAIKLATPAARRLASATNYAVATLVRDATNGVPRAQLLKKAIELDVPRGTAIAIANKFGTSKKEPE